MSALFDSCIAKHVLTALSFSIRLLRTLSILSRTLTVLMMRVTTKTKWYSKRSSFPLPGSSPYNSVPMRTGNGQRSLLLSSPENLYWCGAFPYRLLPYIFISVSCVSGKPSHFQTRITRTVVTDTYRFTAQYTQILNRQLLLQNSAQRFVRVRCAPSNHDDFRTVRWHFAAKISRAPQSRIRQFLWQM